jgi:arylsulfatase A-like enzyme
MRRGLTAALTCAALLTAACSFGAEVASDGARQVSSATRPREQLSVPTHDLPPDNGPNILVVTTDDMRWDELRYVPNVRRYVSSRGLLFKNSFAPNPLCCPSRASFLVGRYSHNHRVYTHEPPYGFGAFDDHVTLGTALSKAGYRTALVGKYLNGYGAQPSKVTGAPSATYVPAGWTDWKVSIEKHWPAGSPFRGGTYDYRAFTQNVNGHLVANRGRYSSEVVGEQVRGLIGKYAATGHPWFIWATPVAPHFGGPAEADDPPDFRTSTGTLSQFATPARPGWVKGRFDDVIERAPGVRAGGRPSERDMSDKPGFMLKQPDLVDVERRALLEVERQRAEALFAWDRQFGRIVRTLRSTGQFENTVIVFTSDNGYFLGEHRQRFGKIKPHEPSLRVPLVIAGPGIPHGIRQTPVTTIDVTATILDLASASLPKVDGMSKVAAFTADQPWTVPVVTEGAQHLAHKVGGFPGALTEMGLRTGRYAYFRYSTGDAELYDLAKDPLQLRSVYRDPAYAPVRRDLTKLWRQYRLCAGAGCRAPLPPSYRLSVEQLAKITAHQAAAIRHYYG